MSHGARRGASPAVVRAMGHPVGERSAVQSARCPLCKGELRFFLGAFGQSLEQCDTLRCELHAPHHPQPDRDVPAPKKFTERKPRKHA